MNIPLPPWPASYIGTGIIAREHIQTGEIRGEHLQVGIQVKFTAPTIHAVNAGRPAFFNSSSKVGLAIANSTGTMPAIGVFDAVYASGAVANVILKGLVNMSPLNFSGRYGQDIYVSYTSTGGLCFAPNDATSGAIVQGLFLGSGLGTTHSGGILQRLGIVLGSNQLYVSPGPLAFRFPHTI